MTKALIKVGTEGTYLNIIKGIYDKLTAKIILNGENLKAFSLKSGVRHTGHTYAHSHHFYLTQYLEVLATAIRQEIEIKGIQIKREEVKLSLFADDIILYIKNPKVSTKKLL